MNEQPPIVPRRRRLRRRRKSRSRRGTLVAGLVLVLLAAAAAVGFGTVAVAKSQWDAFLASCSLQGLHPKVQLGENSYLYATDGTFLGTVPAKVHRSPVPTSDVSKWLPRATIAIEDRRFWQHPGVDFRGTVRAAVADLVAGHTVQGASTLDQQLVDNLYLPKQPHTIDFKKHEACLALKLDKAWGKNRVLRRYLNTVYYGHLAYGVEAAAETYFSKHAKDLGPAQAALLAGLPQAPSQYDPLRNPKAALARRNEVLRAMAASGALPAKAAAGYAKLPLNLRPSRMYRTKRLPVFFDYVVNQLVHAYGDQGVRRGGLRVTTTIDPRLQTLARRAIDTTLDRKGDPAAALVSLDGSGAIRAMASRDHGHELQFNLAVQGRNEAGSTFKTFVLTAAVEEGMNPYATDYLSAPVVYPMGHGQVWQVHTFEGTYSGKEAVAKALVQSDNTVFARLTLDVGPARVAQVAKRMGITSPLLPVPSIGLGTNDVSVLDVASAYSPLMRLGIKRTPYAIAKVVHWSGKADPRWGPSKPQRVVPAGVARTVDQVLQDNVQHGTGVNAQIGRPAAGKTGTTENFTDAWFTGFTRRLTTSVWVGYPNRNVPMRHVHGIEVQGGSFPAMIWAKFMRPATAKWKPKAFPPAGGVDFQPWHRQYQFGLTGGSGAAAAGT
jgi:penicillin-binding protein 1A